MDRPIFIPRIVDQLIGGRHYTWCPIKKVLFDKEDDSIGFDGRTFESIGQARSWMVDQGIRATVE